MDAFIDNIIINEMGFTSTTHDRCIYRKVIDGEPVFLLRQIDDFCCATRREEIAKNVFNTIGLKMRFDTEKEQGIIPFEYLGVVDDYNGVEIRQTEHYIEMLCENYINRLLRSHGWETPSKKMQYEKVEPDISSPTSAAIASLNALELAYETKMSKSLPSLLQKKEIKDHGVQITIQRILFTFQRDLLLYLQIALTLCIQKWDQKKGQHTILLWRKRWDLATEIFLVN